jgi:sugar lactone lactonase YvrE
MRISQSSRVLAVSVVAGALAAAPSAALARRSHHATARRTHHAAARVREQIRFLHTHGGPPTNTHTPDDGDLADQFAAYSFERSAPAATVSAQALIDARQQATQLPTTGGAWTEETSKAYNANPSNYTDPFWSNVGSGFGIVGGRVTALVATPAGAWLAGSADGGIWRSTDDGANWSPVFDSMSSLSIGSLAVAADGSVWAATGESNTSQDSYAGTGIYRSTDDGQTWSPVTSADGSNPIVSRTVFRIAFDGSSALAATNNGLWRYSGGNWSEVLAPAPASDPQPYYDNQVTDVAVDPADSNRVLTVVGWRGPLTPDSNNGFYVSNDGGQTFSPITPTGDIDTSDIGRTTFAYSADGSKLYAVIESPSALAANKESVLQGVFVSPNGDPGGPWTKIADEAKLAASGSALAVGSGYGVGVQAWYNQDLAVDPANPAHVYLGLEEVFETSNGGTTWDTASPYWNYGLACNPTCPDVTHPDQHAMMISGGSVVIGNDGGVYSRPLSDTGDGGWSDLNATLRDLQYYYARAGNLPTGGTAIWGGLQDNGTSLLDPNQGQMVEPAGGDGFDVIVDPNNANRMVGEYTDLTMYSSTDGGHSFNAFVSPGCVAQATVGLTPRHDCDPGARFVAPMVADQTNVNTWVAGGQYVWVSNVGWKTKCLDKGGCTWGRVFNTGSGNGVTALSAANGAIYAAWVGGGGNPGPAFSSGLATNVGGWHQISMAGLPNRYIAGVTVDKTNVKHAIIVFNGYSRRWIPGGGVGHVFETFNAGKSWTDISGNLPDIPGDAVAIVGQRLVLATDAGAFTATDGGGSGTSWSTLGTNLPNASVNDIEVGPNGRTVYAGTHGRGVWSIAP